MSDLLHWLDTAPPGEVWTVCAAILAVAVLTAHWLDRRAARQHERWAKLAPRSEWR